VEALELVFADQVHQIDLLLFIGQLGQSHLVRVRLLQQLIRHPVEPTHFFKGGQHLHHRDGAVFVAEVLAAAFEPWEVEAVLVLEVADAQNLRLLGSCI